MKRLLPLLFVLSTLAGQLVPVPIATGVTVYLHDLFLLPLLLYAFFIRGKNAPSPKLVRPACTFMAVALVSLVANAGQFGMDQLGTASLYLVRFDIYFGIYLAIFWSYGGLAWLHWLYYSGVGFAVIGLAQYMWYPYLRNLSYLGWDPHLYRVFSTFFDPNFAAIIFVLAMTLGLYIYQKTRYKKFVMALHLVLFVALLLTYSRSGYLAFIVSGLVFAWYYKKLMWVVVGGLVFMGVLFLLPKPDGEGVKLLRQASTLARIGNWQRGAILFAEKPFLGHGFNTLRYVQQKRGWVDDSATVSHAGAGLDNSVQFVGATTGIVGLAAYGWLWIAMIGIFRKKLHDKGHGLLAIVTMASLGACFVHSMFINSLFYPHVMVWMWILVAAGERVISFGNLPAVPQKARSRQGR